MNRAAIIVVWLTAFQCGIVHAENAFRLGVSAALSGPAAEFGTAVRNGFLLAKEEQPVRCSSLEYRFADDRYDAKTAISNFNKYRSQDNVRLMFFAGVAPSEAVAPLAERYQIPLIANCQNPEVSRGRRYVIRSVNYSAQYSRLLIAYLRRRGLRRLAVVKTDASYNDALIDGLRRNLRPEESLEIVDAYGFDDFDFKSSIAKLKNGGYDAVGAYLFPGQLSAFLRQAEQQRLALPVFGSDVLESPSEIDAAGIAINEAVYAFNPVERSFVERYLKRYGTTAQIGTAANAYDVASALCAILSSSSILPDGKEMLKRIRGLREVQGVSGRYSYKETPEGGSFLEFPVVVKQIRGSAIQTLY